VVWGCILANASLDPLSEHVVELKTWLQPNEENDADVAVLHILADDEALDYLGQTFGARFDVPPDARNQLGAQLNVWNDDPGHMSQDEIAEGIAPRLRILAQKTWDSPQLTDSYEEFKALARQTR